MCKHRYKIDYDIPSMQLNKNCEYYNLYKKWTGKKLPIDDLGNCIFHSKNIEWKRNEDLPKFLVEVFSYANSDKDILTIDIREFIMTGSGTNIKNDYFETKVEEELFTDELLYSITLKNLVFDKDIVFTFSHFVDKYNFNFMMFNKNSLWHKCIFDKNLHIQLCEFDESAVFSATFHEGIQIDDTSFEHLGMNESKIYEVCEFRDVNIYKSAHFVRTKITGTLANFCTHFNGYVNFEKTIFDSAVTFADSQFDGQVDFKKTKFKEEVYFKNNIIKGTLLFLGSKKNKKMFNKSAEFDLDEKSVSEGKIIFKNVNILQIVEPFFTKIIDLSRKNIVEIGSNCIKYRYKYEKTINITREGRQLVQDIANTFVSFFNNTESINLGVEIIDKSASKILVIYFTSDNIEQGVFIERLSMVDEKLWDFIGAGVPTYQEKGNDRDKKHAIKADIWLKSIFNFVRICSQSIYNPNAFNALQTTFFNNNIEIDTRKEITNVTYNIVVNSLKTNNLKISQSNMKIKNNTVNGTQYVADVINLLAAQNNYSDIDTQMFEAISKFAKNDEEKKELAEAVKEVKSDKDEKIKEPFRKKIVAFLIQNKEVFKTVIKIGGSSLITYYGLSGADELLNLG